VTCSSVGKDGKNGAPGKDGAAGKNGANGKDGAALDKKLITDAVTQAVNEFNTKIAALDKSAKAGNADALKQIAALSVKLGDQIQSVAKDLDSKIKAVSQKAGAPGDVRRVTCDV